jgi:hypothetical protein
VTESGTEPASPAAYPPGTGSSTRPKAGIRRAAACGWCTFGSAAGYVLRGPAMAAAGLAAAVIVACVIAVLWSVLLDGRDPRSPFVRFMLLTCVLTGRPPRDYLLPDHGKPRTP